MYCVFFFFFGGGGGGGGGLEFPDKNGKLLDKRVKIPDKRTNNVTAGVGVEGGESHEVVLTPIFTMLYFRNT